MSEDRQTLRIGNGGVHAFSRVVNMRSRIRDRMLLSIRQRLHIHHVDVAPST
ncbi:MAG: hypothetical protein VXY07_12320 [Planctomycetota bacterium]|nr:hypothetical protein [Planctomycetota bacterium]MEC8431635.1 hypothetical protein [Planctomycetota bacterium]MEC8783607.1 hypothetical protein [Planctomycetota bacterium]MEC9117114.1 hypothetical protein [Planctomycetota bacterium]MEC9149450.1 hypothetical protein [Planctomycetota bacterium]